MNKGINTLITETRANIANAINEGLKAGLPIAVVDLIVDGAMGEIKQILNQSLADEKAKVEQEQEVKDAQVPYEQE